MTALPSDFEGDYDHPGLRSVAAEEYPGDEFPLTYDVGPRNRCDRCDNWQAPEVGAICEPCKADVRDDLDRKYRLENF